jgi:hypothetical protein
MTTQNRLGKFCGLALIGLGLAWIAVVACQVYSPPNPPLPNPNVLTPQRTTPALPGWDAEPLDIPPQKKVP